MGLKRKRQLIGLAYHGAVALILLAGTSLGEATGSPGLLVLSGLVFLAHGLTFRVNPLPRLVQERFIQEAVCPACGEAIDLVQVWNCSCGFVTWEPRHVFSPCPNCKKQFSWIVCPVCERSIPI